MTLKQAAAYTAALENIERDRLKVMAIAARAAQADEKGWKSWFNSLGG